jgi:hypothetical protein
MEAVAWSALGLLAATLIGAIFWLGSRIDGLSSRIDTQGTSLGVRIDAQGTALGARIDGQSSRIDALTTEMSRLSTRLEEHLGRHAS